MADEAEDLEDLERARNELLKRLEADGEEDGEIGDDDEPEMEPQPPQTQPPQQRERQVTLLVPVASKKAAPSPPPTPLVTDADAEPVSDGELEDEPEVPAKFHNQTPAVDTVDRRKENVQAIGISKPKQTPTKTDKYYREEGQGYDWENSYTEQPRSASASRPRPIPRRPSPAPALLPTPTHNQRYDQRPQTQITQIGGSTFKTFDDENWDEPPPPSRPKLSQDHRHSPIEDEEYDWGDSNPTPNPYPPQRDTNTRINTYTGTPEPGGKYRHPFPDRDRDQNNWNSNRPVPVPSPNYSSNQGSSQSMNMNQNQYPPPPPPINNNSNTGPSGAPPLTGRALWAQRALELDKLNPLGDFKQGKKKQKEKPVKPNWQAKPNQPLVPPLPPVHQQFQQQNYQKKNQSLGPNSNPNLDQCYQRRQPQLPQAQAPPMNNWMANTYKNTRGSSCEDENWDDFPSSLGPPSMPLLPTSQPQVPMPIRTQNQWQQSNQSNWMPTPPPPPPVPDSARGSTTPIADIDENWGNEPETIVAPPPPPVPATPLQMANTSTPTLAPIMPESSPSSPISYSAYANIIAKLLHWYGYAAHEIERLLNAPNLFRVKYEQLTVHLSKNESDLEQCFKVIGSDHEAYYKEGYETVGLAKWRLNVSGDVWGTASPKPGAIPPPPPTNPGNSLRAILKPSNQQATTAESRLYFPRQLLEPQNEQQELLALETRTQQDQFNPANATLPYQVFLEYGSFSDGISHEITRFRYVEYVAQVNGQGKDLLASVISAYGLGAGGWPTKVKEWLEMRHGAFKRVQVQNNGPPMNIPLHGHQQHQQQQGQQPPLPLPTPPPTPVPLIPNYSVTSPVMSLPFPRQTNQQPPLPPSQQPNQHHHGQHRTQPPMPPAAAPPIPNDRRPPAPPAPTLGQNMADTPTNINFDHFQRLYAGSNPSLYSPSTLNSAYSEFCKFAASKHREYIQSLMFWFPGVSHDEVERLVGGYSGSGSDSHAPVPRNPRLGRNLSLDSVPTSVAPPPPPVLNGVAIRSKSRASSSGSGSTSSRSKTKTDKPILVTSKEAFRAAYKRRTDIKPEPGAAE